MFLLASLNVLQLSNMIIPLLAMKHFNQLMKVSAVIENSCNMDNSLV